MVNKDRIEYPETSYDGTPMEVVIIRASDEAQRIFTPDWKPHWTWDDVYWWTDGNAGCDCNRARFWNRAGGEVELKSLELTCGTGKFFIIMRAPVPQQKRVNDHR